MLFWGLHYHTTAHHFHCHTTFTATPLLSLAHHSASPFAFLIKHPDFIITHQMFGLVSKTNLPLKILEPLQTLRLTKKTCIQGGGLIKGGIGRISDMQ